MKHEFWKERWDTQQIGFHEGKRNDLLMAHADRLPSKGRILVPLAGRAVDLGWLAGRGHAVTGVEFVKEAIAEIPGVTMVFGDMFEMTPEKIGTFDAIYDRAALVAIEPDKRKRYVEVCSKLAPLTFLIAFSYDQSKTPGPPFSVDDKTVRSLYAGQSIEVLETRSGPISPRMKQAGVDRIDETAYLIR